MTDEQETIEETLETEEDLNKSSPSAVSVVPTIDQLQKELELAMAGWKRTAADFENYQRRKDSEHKELVDFAREVAVAKLLPTLDTLGQAIRHLPEEPSESDKELNASFFQKYEQWKNGMDKLIIQLDKALAELGVKKIEAVGKKFDPHFHEAVKEVEGEEDGIVVDEFQTGFELNGKVIRPSQVVISKRR